MTGVVQNAGTRYTPVAVQPASNLARRAAVAAPVHPSHLFAQLTRRASFCLLASTFWGVLGCPTQKATDTSSAPPTPDTPDPKADSALQNGTPDDPFASHWDFVQDPGTVPIEEDCFQHPDCAVDESTALTLLAAYGAIDKPIFGTARNLATKLAQQEQLGLRFDGNKPRPYWYQTKVLGLKHLTSEDGIEKDTTVYGSIYADGQPELSGPLVFVNESTGTVRIRFHEEKDGFPICTSAYIYTPQK